MRMPMLSNGRQMDRYDILFFVAMFALGYAEGKLYEIIRSK
jgi:cytochrome c oxidase assembly protein Cox11